MKKISIIASIFIAFILVYASCKKDEVSTAPPVFTFTSSNVVNDTAKIEITNDTQLKVDYKINAEAGIKLIKQSINGGPLRSINVTEGSTAFTGSIEMPIPARDSTILIRIAGTDMNIRVFSKQLIIKVVNKNVVALLVHRDVWTGGGPSDYGSHVNAYDGIGYSGGKVNGDNSIRAKVDFVCETGMFTDGTNNWAWSGTNTGIKFATTNITNAGFNALQNNSSMLALNATLTSVNFTANSGVFFITKSGKRGYIWVKSYDPASTNVLVDIKISK